MSSQINLENFLLCPTPDRWLAQAAQNHDILLIDHANCEKKAAATAIHLIHRYVAYSDLLMKMSTLAREELLHFEKVVRLMKKRGVAYQMLTPARYAKGLCDHIRSQEPHKLIDRLIIGAFIEARSCERFHKLCDVVDQELATFYASLFAAEQRHFHDYIDLARRYADDDISARIQFFAECEAQLITQVDDVFRFHSGPGAEASGSSLE